MSNSEEILTPKELELLLEAVELRQQSERSRVMPDRRMQIIQALNHLQEVLNRAYLVKVITF